MFRRREVLSWAGSAAFLLKASPILANTEIGSANLTTLSDGNLVLPGSFIFDSMPQAELSNVLKDFDLTPEQLTPECNLALFQDGENTVLFDIGSGPDFMPTAGTVLDSLDAIGLTPEDITHVVFTHAHPDHIWGLLDDFDEPVFPGAQYMMGRVEWDYWWDPDTVSTIGDARAAFAVGAKRRMETIENSITLIDPEQEILPGIFSLASYGHTPGHMSFELRNGAGSALILGDAVGNHHVAFRHPEWRSGSDQDQDQAIQARRVLLQRAADEKLTVVGFHLPNGGIGKVERNNGAFRFVQGG